MKINSQKGVSLLLTLLIMAAILAIALGLSQLTLGEIKLGRDIPKSLIAYYAAEAGMEQAIYDEWEGSGASAIADCSVELDNESSYGIEVDRGAETVVVRSIGCYSGLRRAIEVSFSVWEGGIEPVCSGGAGTDDEDCGTIDCSGWYIQTGTEGATDTEYCYNKLDITTNRCEGVGDCKDPNSGDCTGQGNDAEQYSCGICKYISASNCVGTILGSCSNYPEGTSCGSGLECDGSGNCGSVCDPDMGDACGGSECVNPGTIQCDGSCGGESNKSYGTPCSGSNPCRICNGSGSCVAEIVSSPPCGGGWLNIVRWDGKAICANHNDPKRWMDRNPTDYEYCRYKFEESPYTGLDLWIIKNEESNQMVYQVHPDAEDAPGDAQNQAGWYGWPACGDPIDEGACDWWLYYCGDNKYALRNYTYNDYLSGDEGWCHPWAACAKEMKSSVGSHEKFEFDCR